jgi:tRNA dimethylallyltransferase
VVGDAILLMGPTASGKTDAALALCREFPLEIVSVDSALVYRGMDIGTAKPSREVLAAAPHHLIDILDPKEPYSAAKFRSDALRVMAEVAARGRTPLLVGGTMLYYKALASGLSDLPESDPVARAELELRLAREGSPALHAELALVDPESAARIHRNDPQRITRALEVFRATGQPLSALQRREAQAAPPWRFASFALAPADRAVLHLRIGARFDQMMKAGFLDEVSALKARGDLHADLPSMRAVGYRQLWEHLEGQGTLDEAVQKGVHATRQLAKRQFTWLRSWPELTWIEATAPDAHARLAAAVGARIRARS